MSIYKKYTFPKAEIDSICLPQQCFEKISLKLNGKYYNSNNKHTGSCYFGFSSRLSILSENDNQDLSHIIFDIVGFQNGKKLTEERPGGDKEVVFSEHVYDYIVSITPRTSDLLHPITNETVLIGTGLSEPQTEKTYNGYFLPISINTEQHIGNLNFSLQIICEKTQNSSVFKIYASLEDIINNGQTFEEMINNGVLVNGIDYDPDNPEGEITVPDLYTFSLLYKTIVVEIINKETEEANMNGTIVFRQL